MWFFPAFFPMWRGLLQVLSCDIKNKLFQFSVCPLMDAFDGRSVHWWGNDLRDQGAGKILPRKVWFVGKNLKHFSDTFKKTLSKLTKFPRSVVFLIRYLNSFIIIRFCHYSEVAAIVHYNFIKGKFSKILSILIEKVKWKNREIFKFQFQSHQLFHTFVIIAAFVHFYAITEMAMVKLMEGSCSEQLLER